MNESNIFQYLNAQSPYAAAIDLGSNTCRLTIADISRPQPRVVDTFSRIVRLGENVASSGHLTTQAMDRAINALTVAASKVKIYKPSRVRAVSTEACRRALNSKFFQKYAYEQTGIDLEIITAREEARLSLVGCQPLFDFEKSHVIVFDIGGGSTEIILAEISQDHPLKVIETISLSFGVVGLSESYGNYCGMVFPDIEKAIMQELQSFGHSIELNKRLNAGQIQLIGCSGTSTTIAALHHKMSSYDRKLIDGTLVLREDVEKIRDQLSKMTPFERSTHPCIGPGRNDLVVPGLAIFSGIYNAFPADKLLVADRGVRDGILIEFANTYNTYQETA